MDSVHVEIFLIFVGAIITVANLVMGRLAKDAMFQIMAMNLLFRDL
jgi:hypothetical protein